jgi:hypothetical protein
MTVVAKAEVVLAVVDEGYGYGEVVEAGGRIDEFSFIAFSGVTIFKRRIVKINTAFVCR